MVMNPPQHGTGKQFFVTVSEKDIEWEAEEMMKSANVIKKNDFVPKKESLLINHGSQYIEPIPVSIDCRTILFLFL